MYRASRASCLPLLALLTVSASAAPSARVADTDFSNPPSGQFQSSLSPDDLLVGVWGDSWTLRTILASTSTDLGSTWTTPLTIGAGYEPEVFASGGGRIDVTWLGAHPTNLVLRRSTDAGLTWGPVRTLPLVGGSMAVSAAGDIAGAGRGPGSYSDYVVVTSTDGGASFNQAVIARGCCETLVQQTVAWVGGQDLLACWRRGLASSSPSECATSTDGGLTFGAPQPIGVHASSLVARANGDVIAVGAGVVTRSTDSGLTWTPPVVLEPAYGISTIATNAAGEVWVGHGLHRQTPFFTDGYYLPSRFTVDYSTDGVSWQRYSPPAALDGCVESVAVTSGNALDLTRIHVAGSGQVLARQGRFLWRSSDLAATWTDALTVVPRIEPTHDAVVVELAGGGLVAFWEHLATTPYELLSSLSTDGGLSWSPPSPVADLPPSLLDRVNFDLGASALYDPARSKVVATATAAGPVWALWLAGGGGDCSELRASRSVDGRVWEPSIRLGHASALQYSMAEDTSGNLVAVWLDVDLVYSRSTDGGLTWSPPAVLYTYVPNTEWPALGASAIVRAADGSLIVLAHLVELLEALRTTDGGASWNSSLVELRWGTGLAPPLLVAAGPRLVASRREYTCNWSCIGGIYNYESWDFGVSWRLLPTNSVPASGCLVGDTLGNVYWETKDRLKAGRIDGSVDDLGPLPHATWKRGLVALDLDRVGIFYADWDDPRAGVFYSRCDRPVVGSSPGGRRRCVGASTTFSFSASGTGVRYQWYRNGAPIPGATRSDYDIFSITPVDAGTYVCVATGDCGAVSSNPALLEVDEGPVVTSSPPSRAVLFGRPTSFRVTTSGFSPLSYQWTKDGVPIVGATSPLYRIGAVEFADAGWYVCTITGPCGLTSSQPAELVVTPWPRR